MKITSASRQSVAQKYSIPVILLLVSLWLAPTARAQFTLDFVYDPGTDTTTATYAGAWNTFSGSSYNDGPLLSLSTDGIRAQNLTYSLILNTTLSDPVPWTNATISNHTGDSWGFNANYIFASFGYLAGTQLSGTLTFVGSNLADLGFDETEISNGGVLGSGAYTVTWTATAVPEPATYAVLLGILVLGCAVYRNRRGRLGR
ncbi:MAG: PEP-CTERM sorting domain-containing protein [Cephaloticoccus sp.]|nr:PEP-CTERM sorting domain-containing protein [Cephaloticoccus sp.]MCF7759654.1 PEP-CTERM sorting domain-containing protein [Cephaloticoccus sp.]